MKILSLLCFLLFLTQSALAAIGTIGKIHGKVLIDGKVAKLDQKIETNSQVEAQDKKSFVVIDFFNGSRILLRNGKVNFKGSEGKDSVMDLASGEIFSYLREDVGLTQKVKTKNAVMGVRGTKFYVNESDADTYLCVCDGKVEIKNEKSTALVSKNEDVHASKGQAFSKSGANAMMQDMAWDEFKEAGFKR